MKYAQNSVTIDGRIYNAGDILPEETADIMPHEEEVLEEEETLEEESTLIEDEDETTNEDETKPVQAAGETTNSAPEDEAATEKAVDTSKMTPRQLKKYLKSLEK
jgi:hypothetical protein